MQILEAGLVPILEPEVDIHSPDKAEAEALVERRPAGWIGPDPERPARDAQAHAARGRQLLPPFVQHPRVLRVVALSGGYTRDEANALLARNNGVVASFSRALTEGLKAGQSPEEFDAALDQSVQSIYEASVT
jgi:fructose-bisphosphate aldolase, class I